MSPGRGWPPVPGPLHAHRVVAHQHQPRLEVGEPALLPLQLVLDGHLEPRRLAGRLVDDLRPFMDVVVLLLQPGGGGGRVAGLRRLHLPLRLGGGLAGVVGGAACVDAAVVAAHARNRQRDVAEAEDRVDL